MMIYDVGTLLEDAESCSEMCKDVRLNPQITSHATPRPDAQIDAQKSAQTEFGGVSLLVRFWIV